MSLTKWLQKYQNQKDNDEKFDPQSYQYLNSPSEINTLSGRQVGRIKKREYKKKKTRECSLDLTPNSQNNHKRNVRKSARRKNILNA